MKKYIIFLILLTSIVNYLYSFDKSKVTVETGDFYFLVGTEGNERAIMYLHIVGSNAYGSYYTESQSIDNKYFEVSDGFSGSFDGENLKLEYGREWDSDKGEYVNQKYITGTLSGDIVFSGKHNSKNVNLSLANAPVNSARIIEEDYDKKFIFNVRALNNLDYFGRLDEIAYLDENIIIFKEKLSDWGLLDTYSINTGKKIEMKDFISNLNDRNLLALLRKKVLEYASNNINEGYDYSDETYYSFDDDEYYNYQFLITPKDIIFCKYHTYRYEKTVSIYLNFTFEELKPFIKRGSPLDYLFSI